MKRILSVLIGIFTIISTSVFAVDLQFTPAGGGRFIYCNNPEGIADDFVLNGTAPRWIMNNENLTPDNYYIYISHFNYTSGYDIELDMAMTATTDAELIIHKAFFETPQNYAYYQNGTRVIRETDWGQLQVCADMLGIPLCDIRGDDIYNPRSFEPVSIKLSKGETLWLSSYLADYTSVQFGKGVHIQALVEITSGTMDFNVCALKSGNIIGERDDISTDALFGEYRWDYTLKGIADTLPQVIAKIDYAITDETQNGEKIPVFLKNQYIPDGHTVTEWYTHLNPQNDIWSKNTSAESDILPLRYKDNSKLEFYGENVTPENRNDIWIFDTKKSAVRQYESRFGIGDKADFKPNFDLDTDTDNHGWACNLGNYGVATTYKMNVENQTGQDKYCNLVITAASCIIAYTSDENGNKTYGYIKDLTAEKVTDNMLSYLIPSNSAKSFEFTIILPVNYNGGIKNELTITDENIQAVDFEKKLQSSAAHTVADVFYGEPLKETVGEIPELLQDSKGGYEYLKGRNISLVRWCAWDGAPDWYYNLWGHRSTVYFLDKKNQITASHSFPSLPCGASYQDGKFYVKTARDGIFATSDGESWEQFSGNLPEYIPYYDLENASVWAIPELEKAWDAGIRLKKHTKYGYNFKMGITREEFCNLIGEALDLIGYKQILSDGIAFTDTQNPNVQKLVSAGIIYGYPDGTFRPKEMLTREMAAAILVRLTEAMKGEITVISHAFADAETISAWAKYDVEKAYQSGLMLGIGDNLFNPQGVYTREQSCATVLRAYEKIQNRED